MVKIIGWMGGEPACRQAGIGISGERNSSALKRQSVRANGMGLRMKLLKIRNTTTRKTEIE